jgi:decaprenyl-phosphate phosphoribosyltransferase
MREQAEPRKADSMAETMHENVTLKERISAHIAIARLDHSIKNLFVLPGIIVPISIEPWLLTRGLIGKLVLAFISLTLVACSNYVINEVLDAPFDRLHPTKKNRAAARGHVNTTAAYIQWIVMMLVGVAIGLKVSEKFALTAAFLWVMGCFYNIPPARTKDVPYLDVLTESINNPIRMLLGWYAVTSTLVPPVSLLISYWMIGCYFMALKRFSEFNEIGDKTLAGSYRASFKLILAFPLVAWTMAVYFKLAFKPESSVQNPEKLYREPMLMTAFASTAVVMGLLLFVRIPLLETFFMPTLPSTTVATPPAQR